MSTCETCGRTNVDPMTLNSAGISKHLCYRAETGEDPRCVPPGTPVPDTSKLCDECGKPFTIDEYGVATHDSGESPDGIDHDADAEHVPYSTEA